MKKDIRLSVVVSVFNGEKVIADCLSSASFADEIIVVDNSSSDQTVNIAKKYTDKIFTKPNNPMLNINKNYGFSKASGEWIFCIDSDEQITLDLQKEIKEFISKGDAKDGYWVPRKNIIFGKWIKHAGWYPDHQLRLFKKEKGKFPEKHVHEMIKINGETGYLTNDLLHHNYSSIQQFLSKLNIYVDNEAKQLLENDYKFKWYDAIRFPLKEFLSRFFARKGYKDGLHGLVLSLLMAFYHLLVFAIIWEKKGFEKIGNENFLEDVEKEFKKASKEISFWTISEKADLIKNPIKKILFRISNKFHIG